MFLFIEIHAYPRRDANIDRIATRRIATPIDSNRKMRFRQSRSFTQLIPSEQISKQRVHLDQGSCQICYDVVNTFRRSFPCPGSVDFPLTTPQEPIRVGENRGCKFSGICMAFSDTDGIRNMCKSMKDSFQKIKAESIEKELQQYTDDSLWSMNTHNHDISKTMVFVQLHN